MPASLSEQIANLALDTFASLPARCKPRTLPNGFREWTPISAIAIHRSVRICERGDSTIQDIRIVALATGTKSLPVSVLSKCNGLILHDCHAEILALRGFNYWLLREMQTMLESGSYDSPWLEVRSAADLPLGGQLGSSHFPFRLREDVEISMFSTEAPCGDASTELLMKAHKAAGKDVTPWPQESSQHSDLPPGRGGFSNLGALRRKPARADAEISMSKSCTDKLMLKQFTGLLGFPVDLFVEPSQRSWLKRLVVYEEQWNAEGYQRAFGEMGRLAKVMPVIESNTDCGPIFFETQVLPRDFRRSGYEKSSMVEDGQKRRASNISAVWIAGSQSIDSAAHHGIVEVVLNGVKQAFKQFDDRERKGSVLCRRNLLREAVKVQRLLQDRAHFGRTDGTPKLGASTYKQLKSSTDRSERHLLKRAVLDGLGGWPSRSHEDDFDVCMLSPSS